MHVSSGRPKRGKAKRQHLVILRPFEDGLILLTMDYADEVRDKVTRIPAAARKTKGAVIDA